MKKNEKNKDKVSAHIDQILLRSGLPAEGEPYYMLQELLYIFYHSQDGIYVVDADGTTLKMNPAFEALTGISEREMLGKNMRDLVGAGYFNNSVALKVIETRQAQTIIQEYTNGNTALVTGNPIFDKDGNLIKIISNIRDITELRQLYDTLSVKERLLQDYSTKILERDLLETYGIIAESEAMRTTISVARRLANASSNVMLLGESGVGKGLIANMIARMSERGEKPFITVNCGAIPEQLMESELFGYVKGSFTGASHEGKAGLVEAADGGILFLDEVGEIPVALQAKLLTFLETKEVSKIGASKQKVVDVRVIASTNRNLKEMVKNGSFREDLYYRLDVISIYIPSLRERREDILPLCQYYMKQANEKNKLHKTLSSEVMRFFINYSWSGNVRQLRNLLERLTVLSAGQEIVPSDLPQEYWMENMPENGAKQTSVLLPISLEDEVRSLENRYMEAALAQGGSIRNAAKLLGISHSSLFRKLKKNNRTSVNKPFRQ